MATELYSFGGLPPCPLPSSLTTTSGTERVPLPANLLANLGWSKADSGGLRPQVSDPFVFIWTGIGWNVIEKTTDVIEQEYNKLRVVVGKLLAEVDWRYSRYARQTRRSLTPTDDIALLDQYCIDLENLLTRTSPFLDIADWPVEPKL